jgi:ribosome maturation protein Sdo1
VLTLIRHGKQGVLNTASNSQLENEFGTTNEDEIIKKILETGEIQSSEVCSPKTCHTMINSKPFIFIDHKLTPPQNSERIGVTNDSKGPMLAH